jgi:hypothetical protein
MKHRYVTLSLALLLSSCATQYIQPTSGQTATISLLAPSDQMFGIGQNTSAVSGEQCDSKQSLAGFHPMMEERRFERTIPAGTRIYLRLGISSSLSYPVMKSCVHLISFVPSQGVAYSVKQSLAGQSCSFALVQQDTQKAPESLNVHNPAPCR